ncbi:hypothetical protein [Actinomadura kijaniata]|uniref:hypothetical protein n=1 Tax=Actinomadura kijaniata TaxID=46161 RepID=UPI000837795A|nr:hypothetical protein [Actinomadura kijaniata]
MNAGRLLVRGGAGVAGTLLLAAAMWLYDVKPEAEAGNMAPIRSTGKVGETVANRVFALRVDRVVVARSLAPSLSFGNRPPVRTDGVFLVVRAQGRSEREPAPLRSVKLETSGGLTFGQATRPDAASVTNPELQPLIWSRSVFLFEVPRDRLAGARLVAGTGGLLPQLSAAAEIDLGITGPRAAELVRTAAERYDPRTDRS